MTQISGAYHAAVAFVFAHPALIIAGFWLALSSLRWLRPDPTKHPNWYQVWRAWATLIVTAHNKRGISVLKVPGSIYPDVDTDDGVMVPCQKCAHYSSPLALACERCGAPLRPTAPLTIPPPPPAPWVPPVPFTISPTPPEPWAHPAPLPTPPNVPAGTPAQPPDPALTETVAIDRDDVPTLRKLSAGPTTDEILSNLRRTRS